MYKWECVIDTTSRFSGSQALYRTNVESGYLYRFGESLCFVPTPPTVVPQTPHTPFPMGQSKSQVIPSFHRQGRDKHEPYRSPPIIDAEFEEVLPQQVNGSKVTDAMRRAEGCVRGGGTGPF